MKHQKLLFILGGTLILLIAAGVLILNLCFPTMDRPTGVLPKISFGMSPRAAESLLGVPATEPTRDSLVADDTFYVYETEIQGKPAKLVLIFKKIDFRNQLYRFQIDFDDFASGESFAQDLVAAIEEEYGQEEGYYCHYEDSGQVEMGVNKGAVGVIFTITPSPTGVSVSATCDEYDG